MPRSIVSIKMPTKESEWSMYVAQRIFPRRRRGIRELTLLFEHAKRTCGLLVELDHRGEPRD